MARFSAYISDSDDSDGDHPRDELEKAADDFRSDSEPADEEEEEEEEEEESEDSSSSSEMHEEELLSSPPRKTPASNALVEEDDARDVNGRYQATVPVRISPTRIDSTIIPWAQQVGVDAQKMHVMQASLFRMPEEAAALKAMNEPIRPRLRLHVDPILHRKRSRESDGDGIRVDSREVRCACWLP
jgi:nuclear pore complex protein Nup98-Nup96